MVNGWSLQLVGDTDHGELREMIIFNHFDCNFPPGRLQAMVRCLLSQQILTGNQTTEMLYLKGFLFYQS